MSLAIWNMLIISVVDAGPKGMALIGARPPSSSTATSQRRRRSALSMLTNSVACGPPTKTVVPPSDMYRSMRRKPFSLMASPRSSMGTTALPSDGRSFLSLMVCEAKRMRIEPCAKRIRAYVGGEVVVDTAHPMLVWEHDRYPAYYLPEKDVAVERIAAGGVRHFRDSDIEELQELVRIEWNAVDEWLEEDEPVYVHPRNPYTRVDILASSRHVVVEVDGVTVADTVRPVVLFETGLPPRFYLPLTDLRIDLLTPTDHTTMCPYKG